MFCCVQQIDEMLAGSLSQEDEDAVLAELEAITQVRLHCQPAQLRPQLQCFAADLGLLPSGRHGASQRAHRRAARRPRILGEDSRFAGSFSSKLMFFVLFFASRKHNYCELQRAKSKLPKGSSV